MRIIISYKEAAHILKNHDQRELREIAEHKEEIIDLCKEGHLYTTDETNIFVAQLAGPEGEDLYAYELVDWYLSCETDSEVMTEEEVSEFKQLGGKIRS
jgi:hypothetical protein